MKQLVLAAAAASLLAAAPAMATLGPHATDTTNGNHCKICHDTAKSSPALRGWAGTVPAGVGTGVWAARTISALCYMCHESAGGGTGGHNMANNAYADTSHGNVVANVPETPDDQAQTGMSTSGLPYVTKTNLECTSCHNVHRQESRTSTPAPFLQRDVTATLCEACHAGRSNATPLRGTANTMAGTRAYSTHPVGTGIVNTGNTDINIKTVAANTAVTRTIGAAPAYALGGHLSNATGNGGTMDCGTCHAVHGPIQNTPGVNDLLAVDNTTGAAGSALCETCHDGGIGSALSVGTLNPTSVPNDHPIDNEIGKAFYPSAVVIPSVSPVNWTSIGTGNRLDRGAQPFFNYTAPNTGTPACSSCHDAHGGINQTAMLRYPGPGATPNVMNYGTWCWVCHTAAGITPNAHHTNTGNKATAPISQLICNDCHGAGANWTAHNGFWSFPVAIANNNSDFCEGCHTATNPRFLITPAFPTTKNKTLTNGNPGTFPSVHGTPRDGVGVSIAAGSSHQVDEAANGTNSNMVKKLTAWAASGGTSEWGAGTVEPICESCHNIIVNGSGTANATINSGWQANLLLQPYEDDLPGTAAGEGTNDFYNATYGLGTGITGDALCRGCHQGVSPVVTEFVHNPAVHTMLSVGGTPSPFTYAAADVPYGRATLTILAPTNGGVVGDCATGGRTTADAAGAPGTASYPAVNQLNCDSCHRPHNADVDSLNGNRYLILEVSEPNRQGTTICVQCHDTDIQCQ